MATLLNLIGLCVLAAAGAKAFIIAHALQLLGERREAFAQIAGGVVVFDQGLDVALLGGLAVALFGLARVVTLLERAQDAADMPGTSGHKSTPTL